MVIGRFLAAEIEVYGSVPRVIFFMYRGYVLRSFDISLARAIVVSPCLGGPGSALPCFGFIGFRCIFV